jgi:hypothetical protein
MGGAVMETAVLMEIRTALSFRGRRPDLYFWRTSNGAEVDIVVENGPTLVPVEVKLSGTPKMTMARGLQLFRQEYGEHADTGWVVHSGEHLLPLGNGNLAVPFELL